MQALETVCDQIIGTSIDLYRTDKLLRQRHFRLDLKDILRRERLRPEVISFSQGYLEFLNLRPVYNEMLGSFSVTVDLKDCVFNPTQCRLFNAVEGEKR